MNNWKVVPISPAQRLDVRPEDLVHDGRFRTCNTYRGGGGYDRFPVICEKRKGEAGHNKQFVVQLHGCHLDCPYCYVTREGVWGKPVLYSSKELVEIFNNTDASVFHLMGGAPALYLRQWPDLIEELEKNGKPGWMFHSDLMLTEKPYRPRDVQRIAHPRALYAVDIKGVTAQEYFQNTRKKLKDITWMNLGTLYEEGVDFYLTFTNCSEKSLSTFWYVFESCSFGKDREFVKRQQEDAFNIGLIEYAACKHVDDVPWGKQ